MGKGGRGWQEGEVGSMGKGLGRQESEHGNGKGAGLAGREGRSL